MRGAVCICTGEVYRVITYRCVGPCGGDMTAGGDSYRIAERIPACAAGDVCIEAHVIGAGLCVAVPGCRARAGRAIAKAPVELDAAIGIRRIEMCRVVYCIILPGCTGRAWVADSDRAAERVTTV